MSRSSDPSFPQTGDLFPRARRGSCVASWTVLFLLPCALLAQEGVHLNPVIAKLEAGEIVYGLSTQDLSLSYARQVARAPADFIYVDMEHSPMDFPALSVFTTCDGRQADDPQEGELAA